jgi:hypothetical protein
MLPSYPLTAEKKAMDKMLKLSRRRWGLRYHGMLSLGRTAASSAPTDCALEETMASE